MTVALVVFALLLQNPAAPQPVAKASVTGVVLNGGTGEPLPNVRVALARTDVSLGAFAQMVSAAGDRPPFEVTYSGDMLATLFGAAAEARAQGVPEAARTDAALKALPLAEIHEVVVGTTGSVSVVSKASPPGFTDDRGRFTFNDVEPGTYRLIFESSAFSKRDYGQRTDSGEGVPLVLSPGQAKNDIVMRLTAVGAISGRVRDVAGQPAAGVPAQLFRFEYDETAKRTMKRVAGTETDDRGEYRLYNLAPGRYYLRAGLEGGSARADNEMGGTSGLDGLMLGRAYSTPNRIPRKYALTYYPGVADVGAAAPIDLQPGTDMRSVDLLADLQKPFRVSGRVVDQRTGQPPPAVDVSIMVDSPDPAVIFASLGLAMGARYNATDGTFEIQNVAPGPYSINATLRNTSPPPARDPATLTPAERSAQIRAEMEAQRAQPKAFAPVRVANANVEGIVLRLSTGVAIPGRLRVEPNAASATPQWELIRVSLSSPGMSLFNGDYNLEPTAGDGTFRTNNVLPGEHRLAVQGVPAGFYVKHARLGSVDVLNAPVRFLGQADSLDILLSPNVGAIEGIAMDTAGQPVPGAQVVLMPQRNREQTELFRSVTADSRGRFSIPSIVPGEYTLAAWDVLEPYAFFDPDVLRQGDRLGRTLQVTESSKQTANVTTIAVAGR